MAGTIGKSDMQNAADMNSRDEVARAAYNRALIPDFENRMSQTIVAINYALFAALYMTDERLAAGAVAAQVLHYKLANRPAQLDRRINGRRREFISRNWAAMQQKWPHPVRRMQAAIAMNMEPHKVTWTSAECPLPLRRELALAAIETGIRCTLLQPLYDAGKAAWNNRFNLHIPNVV
jgi:hypothetical protein